MKKIIISAVVLMASFSANAAWKLYDTNGNEDVNFSLVHCAGFVNSNSFKEYYANSTDADEKKHIQEFTEAFKHHYVQYSKTFMDDFNQKFYNTAMNKKYQLPEMYLTYEFCDNTYQVNQMLLEKETWK